MKDVKYLLTHFAMLQNVDIFYVEEDRITAFQEHTDYNPLCQCAALREQLIERIRGQEVPVIWEDEYQVCFAGLRSDAGYYLFGPMCTINFSVVERHTFFRNYGIREEMEKNLGPFTLYQVLHIVCIAGKLILEKEYTEQELLEGNIQVKFEKNSEAADRIRFSIESEEEDFYRHSYHEERKLVEAVYEGDVSEAVRLSMDLDDKIGKLGNNWVTHWHNMLVIASTVCARAAIEAGVKPYIAYRISGFYINKGCSCKNVAQIQIYRNHAVEELAKKVCEIKKQRHTSNYTEQCKDYISRHYKEKIYLEDIAEQMGISVSHLSRLFKKEIGENIQDYVNDIRVEKAANLLIYSEEPISKIAEYVNFSSQSYFGRIFKERKGMTPKQYRDTYKPTEFLEQNNTKKIKM
jgi:AraC-like DNA-binding protein